MKTRISFQLLLAVFMSAAVFQACNIDTDQKVRNHISDGIAFLYKSDLEKAEAEFDAAIDLKPEFAEGWFWKGNCYTNRKDYKTAMEHYDKAIELNPDYADAYANRGQCMFYITGDHQAGCADFLKAHELGKENLREKIKGCK